MKRLSISVDDFEAMSRVSLEMAQTLSQLFPPLDQDELASSLRHPIFPIRWSIVQEGHPFEFVISEMGSITLRLGVKEGAKKSQTPIFYLSLGKYEEEGFLWEDPEGTPVKQLSHQLKHQINDKIKIYTESLKDFAS